VARLWEFVQRSWLALALLGVATVLTASAVLGDRGLTRVLHLQAELDQANERNFGLLQEINARWRDLEMARTDDPTLERLARRHLGMVRPGEILYVVPPAKTDGTSLPRDEDDGAITAEGALD
jgi:cell division protein FtsB